MTKSENNLQIKSLYHDLEIKPLELKIGPYQISSLSTASFGLDGGAMFGTVPKVLWSRTNPSDEQNRILMDCRCLLLESNEKKILIDTGLGSDFEEKYGPKLGPQFAKFYAVQGKDESGVIRALKEKGLSPDDITDVILTHLHFDHAGGATRWEKNKVAPTFKNAKYYVQEANYEVAMTPNLREKASYYKCNFEPLNESGQLIKVNGDKELLPFIFSSVTDGHTKGQQSIWIKDNEKSLLYCADLIPTATHVRLPWVMGYDLDPLTLIEEKNQELETAVKEESYLFFEHDPYCELAQVKKSENSKDYRLKSLFKLS